MAAGRNEGRLFRERASCSWKTIQTSGISSPRFYNSPGYEPTICSSAEAALEQLREQPFDLVLTDYALPNRTGRWLLDQARAEGLLDATAAVVVTAHPIQRTSMTMKLLPSHSISITW